MAFINNTITSKGTGSGKDLFVRTGTIADTTTFTQHGDSSAKINLDPMSSDVFDVDLHQDKLVVFSTGQVKWVERVDNNKQITDSTNNDKNNK